MPRSRERRLPRRRSDIDLLVTMVVAEMFRDSPPQKPQPPAAGSSASSPPAANRPTPRARR